MNLVTQRLLAGFLTRNEAMAAAQGLTSVQGGAEKALFWAQYREARAEFQKLTPLHSPLSALPSLPAGAKAHIQSLEGSEAFQEAFGGLDYQFALVPIDRITPVQMFSNLEPRQPPPPPADLDALLEYCLPVDARVPCELALTAQGVRIVSPRYGMSPQNVRRRVDGQNVILSLEHVNLVQIRKFGNAVVLFNGTHRAMEMWKAGRTDIPAIVIEHPTPNEVQWPPGAFSGPFLLANPRLPSQGARPPIVPDFTTKLAVDVKAAILPSAFDLSIGSGQPGQVQAPQGFQIQIGGVPAAP